MLLSETHYSYLPQGHPIIYPCFYPSPGPLLSFYTAWFYFLLPLYFSIVLGCFIRIFNVCLTPCSFDGEKVNEIKPKLKCRNRHQLQSPRRGMFFGCVCVKRVLYILASVGFHHLLYGRRKKITTNDLPHSSDKTSMTDRHKGNKTHNAQNSRTICSTITKDPKCFLPPKVLQTCCHINLPILCIHLLSPQIDCYSGPKAVCSILGYLDSKKCWGIFNLILGNRAVQP